MVHSYFIKFPIQPIVGLLLFIAGCMGQYQDYTSRSCVNLEPGAAMHIVLWDNATIDGTFLKMEKMPYEQYCADYKRITSQSNLSLRLPVPGERIAFRTILIPDKEWSGQLVGFCPENMWVRLKNETTISHFYLRGITTLIGLEGRELGRADFRRLMEANSLPLLSSLVVHAENDIQNIALHDTKKIQYYNDGKLHSVRIFTDDIKLDDSYGLLTER